MKISLDAIFNVDRRVVFVFVFLAILIPLLIPFGLPSKPTPYVQDMYDGFESAAAAGRTVFLSFEFEPTGAAEIEPMARSVVRQIFARNGKVVVMCKSGGLQGMDLHQRILADCAQEYGKEYGEDYVYLGYKPGSTNLVINLGQSLQSAYPQDIRGTDIRNIPVTRNVARLADFAYVVIYCQGLTSVVDWLTYGQAPHNLKMGFGVLGNVTPDCMNYVNSGQIKGLLGGLIGAAQYEQLIADNGIGLLRRFSAADIDRSRVPGLCRTLLQPNRPPVVQHVWDALSDEQKKRVEETVSKNSDQLTLDDKRSIATALNDVIARPDIVTDADLAKLDVGRSVLRLFEEKPEVAAHKPQILRRLFVEDLFPQGIIKAQSEGRATRWMTPQSIAHLGLIAAILFGNVCYLWQRTHKARGTQARGRP